MEYLMQALRIIALVPAPVWAVIAACILPAAFLWRLEFSLPDEMGNKTFRLVLFLGSIVLGPLACVTIWQSMDAVVPGFIGGLLSEGLRQLALWWLSRRFPGLTARPVVLKTMDDGTLGLKVGNDQTIALSAEERAKITTGGSK